LNSSKVSQGHEVHKAMKSVSAARQARGDQVAGPSAEAEPPARGWVQKGGVSGQWRAKAKILRSNPAKLIAINLQFLLGSRQSHVESLGDKVTLNKPVQRDL
jgi:hypothetical protein